MTIRDLTRAVGAVVLGGALFFAGGCGYKNAPVPPETVVPKPVDDLLYTTGAKGATLSWSYPVKTIRGSVIENVSSFELYRAEIPLKDYCGGCPIPFGKPIAVAGGTPMDGKQRRRVTYELQDLKSGHKYFFKVNARTSWLAAGSDSNIISFVWMKPLAAPQGLEADAGDSRISLKWQPVTTYGDGESIDNPIQYQLYRSVGGKSLVKLGKPLSDASYVDRQVKNGRKYFYAVQSMMLYNNELVAGGRSQEVSSIPIDLTPPAPPTGVTAVSTGVGIKIFWDRSSDGDLGGYKVYRRAAKSETYTLLGKVEPEFSLFVDRDSGEDVRYYYAVTAIDTATPPNESVKSKEATIRY